MPIRQNLRQWDGALVQDCSISSRLAIVILQSCTKPSIYTPYIYIYIYGKDCMGFSSYWWFETPWYTKNVTMMFKRTYLIHKLIGGIYAGFGVASSLKENFRWSFCIQREGNTVTCSRGHVRAVNKNMLVTCAFISICYNVWNHFVMSYTPMMLQRYCVCHTILFLKTLWPGQNGGHLADGIFVGIFIN